MMGAIVLYGRPKLSYNPEGRSQYVESLSLSDLRVEFIGDDGQ